MNKNRPRLLEIVAARYPDKPRSQLLAHILAGDVYAAGERLRNPAARVVADIPVEIRQPSRYVSQGGEKLAPILELWNIQTSGKVFIDAGASTGGFTDCLLQRGASLVYAVDAGYNQLAYQLRRKPQVRVLERTNVMTLNRESFDPQPHAAVADLSLRSIAGAAAHLLALVMEKWVIALVKPQYEWEHPDSRFKGVVEDDDDLLEITGGVVSRLWSEGSYTNQIALSPVRGRKGNRELFFLISTVKTVSEGQILTNLKALLAEGLR